MDLTYWKIPNSLDRILKESRTKIITRFPPEPSGYLHIGHVKAIFINYVIAKRYGGEMILRFDNTNPVTESGEFENIISDDIAKLDVIPDRTTYSSDYFNTLIEFAEQLILQNKAYVDISPKDVVKKERWSCIESESRNNSSERNMELWQNMKDGSLRNASLRIKIDMEHSNANCRDPTIFRFIDKDHHHTGNSFKIYPTYDFTCPILDSIEGVTHAFRSVEYADREEQYNFILDTLNLRKPNLFCYGKVKIENVMLSKRKIKALIEKGDISSWEDPRLFTLRGLLNAGIHLSAIKQFVATLGFSPKTPSVMSPDKLYSINRKIVDKIATRATCLDIDASKFKVIGKIPDEKQVDKWHRNPELGFRLLTYNENILVEKSDLVNGEEITLMNWNNVIVNGDTMLVNLQGDFKSTSKKLLWVDATNSINILIDTYSRNLKDTKLYFGEMHLLNLHPGDYVQFFKMNYYMCYFLDLDTKTVCFVEIK
jgi:glutamyl/glutaminyl-tRNA synthetase